ncbi:hypothetical protein JOM56_009218 [Amanita muscaria]
MIPSHTLEIVVPRLRELAQVGIPSLSQAADTALLVHNAVKRVICNKSEFEELGMDAALLLYVAADELREKGQRHIKGKAKGDIDSLTGVLQKILDLAQADATRCDCFAFWYSDAARIKSLREELEQRLQTFDVRSFNELHDKASERVNKRSHRPDKAKYERGLTSRTSSKTSDSM